MKATISMMLAVAFFSPLKQVAGKVGAGAAGEAGKSSGVAQAAQRCGITSAWVHGRSGQEAQEVPPSGYPHHNPHVFMKRCYHYQVWHV